MLNEPQIKFYSGLGTLCPPPLSDRVKGFIMVNACLIEVETYIFWPLRGELGPKLHPRILNILFDNDLISIAH